MSGRFPPGRRWVDRPHDTPSISAALLNVNVRSVVLQRRTCGGTWQSWTSAQNTGDTSGTSDTDTTAWVVFPSRVQFRTVVTYSAENATLPRTGRSGTATTGVFGIC